MMNNYITVVGAGYVGLSLAILLAKNNHVKLLDIDEEKVNLVNKKKSPIVDELIDKYLKHHDLRLVATTQKEIAFEKADFVIIATPTDYDAEKGNFNTTSIESVLNDMLDYNLDSRVVIKSTIPLGYTEQLKKTYGNQNIIFSPEFLREGNALHDNLFPSRIIIGSKSERAKKFSSLLKNGAEGEKDKIPIIFMNSTEAEAVKLFSNTYLAMRVAFFNELDTYCEKKGLDSLDIINGVGLDPRIGDRYNNPSFGYGGYCLPKDTKQLLSNYNEVPNALIKAIVESNKIRKNHIASTIIGLNPKVVGIYRIIMKAHSDNFRASAIQDIIEILKEKGVEIIIYEPSLKGSRVFDLEVIKDFEEFKSRSSVILANRNSSELNDVYSKVYSRDLYGSD